MRRLLAALALLTSCVFAQDRAAAPAKNWTDKAESDIANAAVTETDLSKKLADLDKWKAGYPATEYLDVRQSMYLQTYMDLHQGRGAFDAAQDILKSHPDDFGALAATISQVTAIKPAPAPWDLDAAEKAANRLINNPDVIFAAANKPRSWTEAQWAQSREGAKRYAIQVLTVINRAPAPPVQKVEPQYSEEGRLAGLEGSVLVTGTIAVDGAPQNLRVSRPLGLGLDEQAIAAVAQMRFTPGSSQQRPLSMPIDFALPSKQSRWHLIGAEFKAPAGASRPTFAAADYPFGPGISVAAFDEARLLSAIGRAASATVSFDIDERGSPRHFQVVQDSEAVWGPEAVMLIQSWRFHPGMQAGMPVSVPCTLTLVWGPEDFASHAIAGQVAQIYPPPPSEPPLRIDPVADAVINSRTEPEYTEEARRAGVQGSVWIALTVDEQGMPANLKVDGPLLGVGLEGSALEAIRQWRFQPMFLNGQPTARRLMVRVDFQPSGVESYVTAAGAPKAAPKR